MLKYFLMCENCDYGVMSDNPLGPEVCPHCNATDSYSLPVRCGSCGGTLAISKALELREGKKTSYCCPGCAEESLRFASLLFKSNPLERVLKAVELC